MAINELELRILALELAAVMPETPRICEHCARRMSEPIVELPVMDGVNAHMTRDERT